jgi:putative addiction module killer protein
MIIKRSVTYIKWFEKLKDQRAKARITKRLLRIEEDGNLGDTHSVGGGVSEIRIDYGQGYRLYYTIHGNNIMLLLLGADKNRQQEDIAKAQAMLKDLNNKNGGNK